MDKQITAAAIATSNTTSSRSNLSSSSSVENTVVIGAGRRKGVVWNLGNVIDKVTAFYASMM
eukprot:10811920-Ditylum_brightwellii.AAC.1